MRKRTMKSLLDNVMWYILYFLPVIAYLIILINNQFVDTLSLSYVFDTIGLSIVTDSVVYTTLLSIFGVGGVFPMFISTDLILYFTYFIYVNIIHLAVDVIVFIPRLAHHFIDSFGKGCGV